MERKPKRNPLEGRDCPRKSGTSIPLTGRTRQPDKGATRTVLAEVPRRIPPAEALNADEAPRAVRAVEPVPGVYQHPAVECPRCVAAGRALTTWVCRYGLYAAGDRLIVYYQCQQCMTPAPHRRNYTFAVEFVTEAGLPAGSQRQRIRRERQTKGGKEEGGRMKDE